MALKMKFVEKLISDSHDETFASHVIKNLSKPTKKSRQKNIGQRCKHACEYHKKRKTKCPANCSYF